VSTIINILDKSPSREKRRFPIEQDLRCRCGDGRRFWTVGIGKTTEISRDEVCFTTQVPLKLGARVNLDIDWPAVLDNTRLLTLEIRGSVVRSAPDTAVIKIARYIFRTRGASLARPGSLSAGA